MRGSAASSTILVGVLSLFLATRARGLSAFWPVKTTDFTNGGYDCDALTEQYLKLEAQDWHDHPKITMRWRQTTGPCGEIMDESELLSWEASYDGSTDDAPDDPPTAGNQGRVQLNLHVCAPFGAYEIDLDVESYSDESVQNVEYPPSTSWTIWNGVDEHELWRTVYSGSHRDIYRISPKVPGHYTWPVEGAMGYYGDIIAGPLPPLDCGPPVAARHLLLGCFADSKQDRLLNTDTLTLIASGPGGMTEKVCSRFCRGFDYFGLEFGSECFCGTAEEFEGNAVASDQCGLSITDLCTGDPTTACGGRDAIRVYRRLEYALLDCFQDNKMSRIMQLEGSAPVMSAQICYDMCNDGINKYFGTQYATECWCAADADLMKHGEVLDSTECDMPCAGTVSGEYCGGWDKITAYKIKKYVFPQYIGCYADAPARAMDAEGMHVTGAMTNEVCISYCAGKGHAYAGTQYAQECWCGDSYDLYSEISDDLCYYSCEGDTQTHCGGDYALSVWSTD